MKASEFTGKAHDGVVELPPEYRDWNGRRVRVTLLAEEQSAPKAGVPVFKAVAISTRTFKFDRDEANAR
jgi:hypothetical protein